MRLKHRYIVFEIRLSKDEFEPLRLSKRDVYKAILRRIEKDHGTYGFSVIIATFAIKYYNRFTKVAIARCRRGPHRIMASTLPFISNIDNINVQLHTLYTAATLCQCYKFLKKHQQDHLQKFYKSLPEGSKRRYRAYEEQLLNDEDLEVSMKVRKSDETDERKNTENISVTTENTNTAENSMECS